MVDLLSLAAPVDEFTYGNGVKTLRVLIECEKGSTHKYEYDSSLGAMVIVRDLHSRYPYPYNYGSIPQTLAADGDSLDAIVLSSEAIRSGTVVNCYPVGVIRMTDRGQQDDKLICVPYYATCGKVNLRKIVRYLRKYKFPEKRGITNLSGFEGVVEAWNSVYAAHAAYLKEVHE